MNTIGGLTIPAECIMLTDAAQYTGVQATVRPSVISGAPNIWEQTVGGRRIDLQMSAGFGYILRSDFNAIRALATIPEAVHTLVYNGTTYTVRFRNEEDGLPITAQPLIEYVNEQDDDIMTDLHIKLMVL